MDRWTFESNSPAWSADKVREEGTHHQPVSTEPTWSQGKASIMTLNDSGEQENSKGAKSENRERPTRRAALVTEAASGIEGPRRSYMQPKRKVGSGAHSYRRRQRKELS